MRICALKSFGNILNSAILSLGRFALSMPHSTCLCSFASRNAFRDESIASTDSYEKTEKKFPSKVVRETERESGTRRRVRCHVVVAVGSGRLGVNLFRKSTGYIAVVAEDEGRQASRSFGKTSSYVSPGPPPSGFQLSSRTGIFFKGDVAVP